MARLPANLNSSPGWTLKKIGGQSTKSASPFIRLLLLAPLERDRRPLTRTEDKCACQGSILMPFNVCQPSSLLITFLPYQLQEEKKTEGLGWVGRLGWGGGQLAHIPCGSDYLGRERSWKSLLFKAACNSTPPPAHRYLHHAASQKPPEAKDQKKKKKLSNWLGLLLSVVKFLFSARSFRRVIHGLGKTVPRFVLLPILF